MCDYMGTDYTPFEQNVALSWASAVFSAWLAENPHTPVEEREKQFFQCVEGGLSIALEFRKQNT